MERLASLRATIDGLDNQMLALLNARVKTVLEIAEIKQQTQACAFVPSREQEIYARLIQNNPGPLGQDALVRIFREVVSASRAMEGPVTVAYLGPRATFTHRAALCYFGGSVKDLPFPTIQAVFEEVERDRVDFGVVPIENSTEGVVNHTLDLFLDSQVQIFGEIMQEIEQHLLASHHDITQVQCICSHPHALAQCKDFLRVHMPGIALRDVESTAHAAEMARDNPHIAAIASELAAQLYHLVILKRRIEDHPHNATRFLIVSKQTPPRGQHHRTSLLLGVQDKAGALYEILRPFSERKINLTRIESHPSRRKAWEYFFYIDAEGHVEDPPLQSALDEIRRFAVFIKILGAYPAVSGRSA